MQFTYPAAPHDSPLSRLPPEIHSIIYKELSSMHTVNQLRATCQHMHDRFRTDRRRILKWHQEKIVNPFLRYYKDIGAAVEFADSLIIPDKTQFLQDVMTIMPYRSQINSLEGTRDLDLLDWRLNIDDALPRSICTVFAEEIAEDKYFTTDMIKIAILPELYLCPSRATIWRRCRGSYAFAVMGVDELMRLAARVHRHPDEDNPLTRI